MYIPFFPQKIINFVGCWQHEIDRVAFSALGMELNTYCQDWDNTKEHLFFYAFTLSAYFPVHFNCAVVDTALEHFGLLRSLLLFSYLLIIQ